MNQQDLSLLLSDKENFWYQKTYKLPSYTSSSFLHINALCVAVEDQHFQFVALPFRLSSAPQVFTKVLYFLFFYKTMAFMLQPCLLMFRLISFFKLSAGNQLPKFCPPALMSGGPESNLGHSPGQNFSFSRKDCLFKILSLVWTICRRTFLSHQPLDTGCSLCTLRSSRISVKDGETRCGHPGLQCQQQTELI